MSGILRNILNRVQNKLPKAVEVNDSSLLYWYWLNQAAYNFYQGGKCEKFSDRNAYHIARSVAEVFFPIDSIADRVASLKFDIVDRNGELTDPPENIQRLLDQPNPFSTFSGLMYDSVFYELSDGNNWLYTKTPRSIKGISPDTISSVWALEPDKVSIKTKTNHPSIFDITSISELISEIIYTKYGKDTINPDHVIHERSLSAGDHCDGLLSPSPLQAAERNINNLLVVYQARYKVYDSNGNAGILTRDSSSKNNEDIDAAVNDPISRDMIVNDILDRNGLSGDKKLWTVSAIPLRFIKTLATISELQPFDETREDALQIAGIYGVDKDLLPMKEGTTYTNKERAEINLYQNVVKGMAADKAKSFTKAFALDKIGLRFQPNYQEVEVLQTDVKTSHEGDSILIDNLIKMKNAGLIDEDEIKDITDKIIEEYKNG